MSNARSHCTFLVLQGAAAVLVCFPPAAGHAGPPRAAPARAARQDCRLGPAGDAAANAASLTTLAWAPFRRPEIGWDIYAPLAAREIGSACDAASPGFAAALSRWRRAHGLGGSGVMDTAVFTALQQIWLARRPFVIESRKVCPPPPPESALSAALGDELWGGKPALALPEVLSAYRAMRKAAREGDPVIAADHKLMSIFSAYRSPDHDAARCALENNCQGVTRTVCSAHRTAMALDLYLGAAPGSAIDTSADINRRFISQSASYRWMVRNAARFGFVNYPFEPWHWEWTGKTNPSGQIIDPTLGQ